jgi:RNA polymerase sigma-70 factor (ECF subfamily)
MRGSKARPLVLASSHDVELAALASSGDRPAFGELVRRHGSAVRALLRRMGADESVADDVAQDAFLIAFEQISDFRGEGAFQAWVKRIAARQYVKRRRREARIDLMAELPEPASGTFDGGTAAVSKIDLDEAIQCLSAAERLCVGLCYGGGLSHAEAADALNAPLGTVKSHVKRGLDKLRARLTAGEDGAGSQLHGGS